MYSFKSGIKVNAVVFIESLRADELHTGRLIEENIGAFLDTIPIYHGYHAVGSRDELFELLDSLCAEAETGNFKPIIQIDAHGDEGKTGIVLQPSGEIVTWRELCAHFQSINAATANNLLVILASCFGFHGIEPVSITELTPFFYFIAPEHEVGAGVVEQQLSHFYRALFSNVGLEEAFGHLDRHFRILYTEKLLAIGFVRYLATECRGKGAVNRRERLLSEMKKRRPSLDISEARKALKSAFKQSGASLDYFKEVFLLSNHPENSNRFPLTVEDCIAMAERLSPEAVSRLRQRRN